jgi:type II secretory pathway component PulC
MEKSMKKLILILFAVSLQAGETNIYESIVKRNAFDLTAGQPKPVSPPAAEILKSNVYLTGLTYFKGVRKVHLVLKRAGKPNKFASLSIDEKQHNIELKKINKDTVLISNNGQDELLSFEKNSFPTTIIKAAPPTPPKKESSERKRQYDEWKKRRESGK